MAFPTAIGNGGGGIRSAPHGPYKSSGGAFYVVASGASFADIRVMKATDPENGSFSEVDSADRPTISFQYELACVQEGDVIHMATQHINADMTPLSPVRYHTFNMATDQWVTVNEAVHSPASTTSKRVTLTLRSGGPVISYHTSIATIMGTDYRRLAIAYKSGGSWTTNVALDPGGEINYFGGFAALGASDRIHFFYRGPTNSLTVATRSFTSSNTLDTQQATTSTGTGSVDIGEPLRYDDGGTIRIRLPFTTSSDESQRVMSFDSGANPTMVESTVDGTAHTTGSTLIAPLVYLRSGTTDYFLYIEATGGDLSVFTNANGAGWTGPIDVDATVGSSGNLSANVYTRNGATVIGIAVDDGVHDYTEYLIAAAAALEESEFMPRAYDQDTNVGLFAA